MKQVKTTKQAKGAFLWQPVAIIAALLLLAAAFTFRDSIVSVVVPTPTQVAPAGLPAGVMEQAGFVEVRQMPNVKTFYLFAEPKPTAEKVDELQPGARGELLGQDASSEWLYVRFGDKTGWMPIYFLIVTAVE